MVALEILRYSLLFLVLAFGLNAILKIPFDKLTNYGDAKIYETPTWFTLTFMVFGFLMFPFYKRIREYRKIRYIKKEIEYFETWFQLLKENGMQSAPHDYNQYINYKRYLKLRKLKKKI